MLPKTKPRERVNADPARVIIRAREGHMYDVEGEDGAVGQGGGGSEATLGASRCCAEVSDTSLAT